MTAATQENLRKVLTLHSRASEAEARATGIGPRSGHWTVKEDAEGAEGEAVGEREREWESPVGERAPSAPARELLKFSTPRDPALLAQFVKLRVRSAYVTRPRLTERIRDPAARHRTGTPGNRAPWWDRLPASVAPGRAPVAICSFCHHNGGDQHLAHSVYFTDRGIEKQEKR